MPLAGITSAMPRVTHLVVRFFCLVASELPCLGGVCISRQDEPGIGPGIAEVNMSGKTLRNLLMGLVLGLGASAAAWAQWVPAYGDPNITNAELRSFDGFLDSHPGIQSDLYRNPGLTENASYLYAHPELREYLARHPWVRQEVRENPARFVRADRRWDQREDWRWRDRDRDDRWRRDNDHDRDDRWRRDNDHDRDDRWRRDSDHDRDDRWRRDHDHDRDDRSRRDHDRDRDDHRRRDHDGRGY